jgi:4-amino-4-deoxy-L-arabinose transferase-like glycosyltransferase
LRNELQAIGVVAVIVLMPELMINLARVGNESLALICYSLLFVAALQVARQPQSWRWWILLGITLGVGLLTKAYFLTAIPAVIVLAAIIMWSARDAGTGMRPMLAVAVRFGAALVVALAIAGGWYARVHAATGSWSGQGDDAALRHVSLLRKLSAIPHVNWKSGALSVVVSHMWFGGWSFLRVPRVLYVAGMLLIVVAIAGVVIRLARRQGAQGETRDVLVLSAFYLCFWAGLAYHVLVTFLHLGVSASTGWYLYALVAAEIVLLVWGLEAFFPARVIVPLLTIAAAGLDLYGMHGLLMPYYTGLTFHRGDSVSPALGATIRQMAEVFTRLSETRPAWLGAPVLVTWWLGYWAATVGTVLMVLKLFRRQRAGA